MHETLCRHVLYFKERQGKHMYICNMKQICDLGRMMIIQFFVIYSFSKCYFMPQMSQVLSLKLVIYRLSGLWRMNLISIGRDKNEERFWREKNAWNKGVNVEKRMALLGCSFLFEGYKCCFLCLKLLIFFLLLLSPTPLPYRLMFVLCIVSYFIISFSGKFSQRTFSHLHVPVFWLSC